MYSDHDPCRVCGSPVELAPRTVPDAGIDAPVGPTDGVVGTADDPVDERICTNPDCPSHTPGADSA